MSRRSPTWPWGVYLQGSKRVFATSLEVHYPTPLCDAPADTIAIALQKQGIVPTAHLSANQTARAFTNLQAGTSKVPTFLPEYKYRFATLWNNDVQFWPHQQAIPPLSKLVHDITVGGDDVQLLCKAVNEQCVLKKLEARLHERDFSGVSSLLHFPCVVCLKIYGIFGMRWNLSSRPCRPNIRLMRRLLYLANCVMWLSTI